MSILEGGIFSRPRGKTGGVVFGAARSRQGKKVTSRLLVPPSNPNTPAQQTQRSIFSECQSIIKRFGPAVYQSAWNRSVGQLSGFNSIQSIYMHQMDSSQDLSLVNPVNLGTLHYPDTVTFAPGIGHNISVTYSSELGSNGTAGDQVVAIMAAKTAVARAEKSGVVVSSSAVRSDGSLIIANQLDVVDIEVYVYLVGAGTAAGLLSVAYPYQDTTA